MYKGAVPDDAKQGLFQCGAALWDSIASFITTELPAILPESGFLGGATNESVAVHALRFVRVRDGKPSDWGAEGLELDKVPPILLQEAWADYHAIAAAGTGFDPNWEKLGAW